MTEVSEFVRVVSTVARVTSVDEENEDFPLVEVVKPSGRRGVYRLSTIGRQRDQGKAAEKYRSMGGEVRSLRDGSCDPSR